jgi:transcriptional regulator with XRE-family HTH domain
MTKKTYRDAFVAVHVSNTVASQIASLRAERKWTQGELAEKSGMRQSRISALEDPNNENFEIKTLERLASAFDVALTVRFVPYSEIALWASNIPQNQMSVPDFGHDALVNNMASHVKRSP